MGSLGLADGVGHAVEAAVGANHGARVETLQPELLVIELPLRLGISLNEYLVQCRHRQ